MQRSFELRNLGLRMNRHLVVASAVLASAVSSISITETAQAMNDSIRPPVQVVPGGGPGGGGHRPPVQVVPGGGPGGGNRPHPGYPPPGHGGYRPQPPPYRPEPPPPPPPRYGRPDRGDRQDAIDAAYIIDSIDARYRVDSYDRYNRVWTQSLTVDRLHCRRVMADRGRLLDGYCDLGRSRYGDDDINIYHALVDVPERRTSRSSDLHRRVTEKRVGNLICTRTVKSIPRQDSAHCELH